MLLTEGWDVCVILLVVGSLKFCKAMWWSAALSQGVCLCVCMFVMWTQRPSTDMTLVFYADAKLNIAKAHSLNTLCY